MEQSRNGADNCLHFESIELLALLAKNGISDGTLGERRQQLDVWVLLVPTCRLLVRMANAAQHRFAQRLSGDLHAER